jgi:hypothetical protein
MAHVLVIVSAAIGILITVVLFKRSVLPELPISLVVFSFMLVVTGTWMIYTNEEVIEAGLAERSWPSTDGVIIKSEVAGKRAYHPEITFRYSVAGKAYLRTTDLGTPGFGNRNSRLDTAERISENFSAGSHVTVHYDPGEPGHAFIRIGPSWQVFIKLSLGIIIMVTGLIGFAGNFLHHLKRQY